MNKKILFVSLMICLSLGVVTTISAQDSPTMAAQVNVFGVLSGSYVANFEYMALPWLGAMAEAGGYLRDGNTGFNVAAHGRFHVKPQMDSFFVAPFLRYQQLSGEVTENSTDYSFSASVLTTGVNIGKRWIFGPGISLVARAGWGPSIVNTTYDDAEPASSGLVDDLLGIFAGFDGELSAGWAF